ncbi:MAG: DUF5915 domain-containing protein, partial [Chloroflexi bacterium]|nr:DUF5915 domain-containing protein [Chloroflexota bacterium]
AYATLYECLTVLTRLLAPFMPFFAEHLYQNLVRSVDGSAPESVHLTDYPVADTELIDSDLIEAMNVAQRVVALGRAARDRASVKVRQPLAGMFVRVPATTPQESVRAVEDLVLEELNVRELRFAGESDEFLSYSVRPNLPSLGPRYGKLIPAIRRALDALDPAEVVRTVQAGSPISICVDGRDISLLPADILATAEQREGFAAMAEDGFLVALDINLTQSLIEEGWVREVVRRLNDWRKLAGFNVEDRITIRYTASPRLAAAIGARAMYIRTETLAVSLEIGEPLGSGYVGTVDFGGETLAVELQRSLHR